MINNIRSLRTLSKNTFNQDFYSVREAELLKSAYKRLLQNSYNKEIEGYLPQKNANVTNIHSLVEGLTTNFKEVVVFAVDAVSYNHFLDAGIKFAPDQSLLGVLTSVFPSTTGSAWPSIITGASPSEHGIYGTSFLLEKFNQNYIWISGTLNHKGERTQVLDSEINLSLSNKETIFEKLKKKNIASYYIGTHGLGEQNSFRSLLTKGAIHHEPIIQDYATLKRDPNNLIKYFTENTSKYLHHDDNKKLIWNYIDLDDFAHEQGYEEIKNTLFWSSFFLYWKRNKKRDRAFVLISDHGQTPQDKFDFSILKLSEENDELEYNTGGAGRVLYFYPKYGKEESVRKWLQGIFGETADIYRKSELISKLHLFSEDAHGLSRIGNLIVIAKKGSFPAVGCKDYIQEHGALDEDEMFVPLVLFN